ncbi:aminopeptidase P family protein [Chryseobacterium gambrini]|uniref:Aminopeptidase P family protein n=1 Tax=Chryseobacterium gambrini TaxID=373672 RepID=A0AAJ1R4X2_9FLAO|nr:MULTISPECIES: aminopeptidase P family protein [Chryseobacterium]MDN4014081.1 aminopeptidase P family protein [Chryseobacterium gambrini]MDN4028134.1 aminopeptidase P family protein [Chryseobacterium gambrini]QWA39848.1 aminopeptidase P family N-terminal domain-containing protein [Chryseobacterium sp. ZHDP1]
MTSKEKVAALREEMQKNNVDAFIVYSADPHMSEYLPEEWQERAWLSGFLGSAGFVVVTKDKAGLWTDGRYFTQAPIELAGSGIDLFKDGMEGTPHYIDWIISEIPSNGKVAVNALATSHANWELLTQKLSAKNITLEDLPLLKEIWKDRGTPSKNPIYVHPVERAGKSVVDKIAAIRQKMEDIEATVHIISSLDDVAWTLNLRGSDVESNPVFLGYIVITKNDAKLFTDLDKLEVEARRQLDEAWVKMMPYEEFYNCLKEFKNEKVLVSPNSNQSIFEALKSENDFIKAPVPGNLMKAQKNETELEGFRKVMVRDGVAMVKFLYWLTHNAGKEAMNEYSIGEKLRGFRAEGENFVGESFGSIVGYKDNGAIMHYSAKSEGSKEVTNDASILVDSGGQYLEGTTDITRTLALGAVSEEFKRNSTLVLQGLIRLSMVKFPKGTRGVQLDAIARLPLWMEGKDYNHGTGHGVGSFMNVHEGPQNIRKDMNPQELLVGMVCSNEPGYYLEGEYGIRHENLIAVKESETTIHGTFYEFETLTFCPFFKDTIVKEILSEEEINWLNAYHKTCEDKIAPYLEGEVKNWFLELVSPL